MMSEETIKIKLPEIIATEKLDNPYLKAVKVSRSRVVDGVFHPAIYETKAIHVHTFDAGGRISQYTKHGLEIDHFRGIERSIYKKMVYNEKRKKAGRWCN